MKYRRLKQTLAERSDSKFIFGQRQTETEGEVGKGLGLKKIDYKH